MQLPVTKEIEDTRQEVNSLVSHARKLEVRDGETYIEAGHILHNVVRMKNRIKTVRDAFTKPARDIISQAKELFDPMVVDAETMERNIKQSMLEWQTKLETENQRITDRLERRVLRGSLKLETAVKKASLLMQPDMAEAGVIQSSVKKVRITNPALIPQQYWVIDEAAIRRDALGNKARGIEPIAVPGTEVYEEQVLAVR